jgi:hypothetical protein
MSQEQAGRDAEYTGHVARDPAEKPFGIRAGLPSDTAYVIDTWAHSLSPGARALFVLGFGEGESTLFAIVKRGIAKAIPTADLRIAHVTGSPDAILGWSIRNGGGGRFVYLRHGARDVGIEKALS